MDVHTSQYRRCFIAGGAWLIKGQRPFPSMSEMRFTQGGLVGFTTGIWWASNAPAADDIDADNEGVMNPPPEFIIDLSRLAGRALGYQANMMSKYKVHGIKVAIRPVDDAYDNDSETAFAGIIDYFPATKHGIKALQLARRVEKATEAQKIDADSLFLSTEQDYSGFRYGWAASQQVSAPVAYSTACSVTSMPDTWDMDTIFNLYDGMTAPCKENALFGGRAPEQCSLMWSAAWSTLSEDSENDGGLIKDHDSKYSITCFPLLRGLVKYSSGDEAGGIDDDYRLWVEVDFTAEVGDF